MDQACVLPSRRKKRVCVQGNQMVEYLLPLAIVAVASGILLHVSELQGAFQKGPFLNAANRHTTVLASKKTTETTSEAAEFGHLNLKKPPSKDKTNKG